MWGDKSPLIDLPPDRVPTDNGLSGVGHGERINDAVGARPAAAPSNSADQLFVNVEVELKEGGQLRDAVAELASGAGFQADLRFPATHSAALPRNVSLWGWLPSGRVGAAAQLPSVRRLSSLQTPRAEPGRAVSRMVIGLRIPAGVDAASAVAVARAELSSDAGVVWLRTIGYQAVPGSSDLAMISLADVPVRSLSRVLAHSSVLRVAPAPTDNAIPYVRRDGSLPLAAPARRGFLGYVAQQSPVLLVLTVLLLLPPLTSAARRLSRLL